MLGEPYSEAIDSTIGVELHKAVCTIHRDDKSNKLEWKLEESDEVQQRILTGLLVKEEIKKHAATASTTQQPAAKASAATARVDKQPPVHPADPPSPTAMVGDKLDELVSSAGHWPTSPSGLADHTAPAVDPFSCDLQSPSSPASPQSPTSAESSFVAEQSHGPNTKPRARHSSAAEDSKLQAESAEAFQSFLQELKDGPLDLGDEQMYFVDIWDFAGQDSFSAVQHMLLADLRCAYGAVFDVSLALEGRADPTFCRNGEELKISCHYVTNFDVLERWLNIIHQVIVNLLLILATVLQGFEIQCFCIQDQSSL